MYTTVGNVSRHTTSQFTYTLASLTSYPSVDQGEGCTLYNLPYTRKTVSQDNGYGYDSWGAFSEWNGTTFFQSDSTGFSTNTCLGTISWADAGQSANAGDYCNPPSDFPNVDPTSQAWTLVTNTCVDGFKQLKYFNATNDVEQYGSADFTYIYDDVTTLSELFTEVMLRNCIVSLMPAWPTNWGAGTGTAFYQLSGDHVCGSGGQMRYQLKVPNSAAKTLYTLEWQEVTQPSGSTNIMYSTQDENIHGTGDPVNPAAGKVHFVQMPTSQCTIYESAPSVIRVTSDDGGGSGGASGGGSGGPPGEGGTHSGTSN